MFADEARFGRMNRPRPCWAPRGVRPSVAAQLIREYIYLYGAVSPKDGRCAYLIMPTSNTDCFRAFLDALAKKFASEDILLVLDGAPNHRCGSLAVPSNISLLFLPPYAPELNPQETSRDEIREKIFKNYALKSMDAVHAKLEQAILYIERNRKPSITSFPAHTHTAYKCHSDVEMVTQVRRAIAWIFQNAGQFDGDPNELHISGHSSGGHLAACVAVTDWVSQFGLPRQIVRSVVCASGIYDLRPVRLSARNDYVKLDAQMEDALSPIRHLDRLSTRILSPAAHSRVTSSSGKVCEFAAALGPSLAEPHAELPAT